MTDFQLVGSGRCLDCQIQKMVLKIRMKSTNFRTISRLKAPNINNLPATTWNFNQAAQWPSWRCLPHCASALSSRAVRLQHLACFIPASSLHRLPTPEHPCSQKKKQNWKIWKYLEVISTFDFPAGTPIKTETRNSANHFFAVNEMAHCHVSFSIALFCSRNHLRNHSLQYAFLRLGYLYLFHIYICMYIYMYVYK